MKTIKKILILFLAVSISIVLFFYIVGIGFGKVAYKTVETLEVTKKDWKRKKINPIDTIQNKIISFAKDTTNIKGNGTD